MQYFRLKKNGFLFISRKKEILNLLSESIAFLFDNYEWKLKINKGRELITTILVSSMSKSYNEFFLNENVYLLGEDYFVKDFAYPEFISSLLLHELKHLEQFENKKNYRGKKAEMEAYKLQRKFLKQIKYDTAVDWLDDSYKSEWWKSLDLEVENRDKTKKFLYNYLENKLKIVDIS